MKNNQISHKEWALLRLAMDLSQGSFAWDFFGRMSATYEGGYAPMKSPDEYARDYLSEFHSDALYDLEIEMSNNSQKGLAIPV